MSQTAIIVPARLGSTRFPRKLLHSVRGRPLILWTAERIRNEAPDLPLHFAVGEQELADVLVAHGYSAILTDPDLPSGTDRLAKANETVQAAHVINVQADEPLVTGRQISALQELITSGDCSMATLGVRFKSEQDYRNPNRVKVIMGEGGRAIYFSRAPIPFSRDTQGTVDQSFLQNAPVMLHLGLYAYTAEFLSVFPRLPQGRLESIEKLEQLRALENGYQIRVAESNQGTIGIDVPDDVAHLELHLA